MMIITILLVFLGLWRSFAAGKVLRIIDGKIVDNNKYPFAVMIMFDKENGNVAICSGTLISAQWVLTAAHCIRAGTYTQYAFVGNQTKSYRKVLKGFPHPNYKFKRSVDIGLILIEKLEGVKLARVSGMDYKSLSGLPVTFAGFGDTNDIDDRFVINPFQIGEGVVVNCNSEVRFSLSPGICVAPKCNRITSIRPGDSGGPLIFRDTIIGVASKFAVTPVTAIFCPVSPYLEWINVVMTTQQ